MFSFIKLNMNGIVATYNLADTVIIRLGFFGLEVSKIKLKPT